jgi:hypothetical protein
MFGTNLLGGTLGGKPVVSGNQQLADLEPVDAAAEIRIELIGRNAKKEWVVGLGDRLFLPSSLEFCLPAATTFVGSLCTTRDSSSMGGTRG